MNDLLHLTGLTHPLVLHAPIGALVALVFAELWYGLRGRELGGRPALAVFCALAGATSALSGWLLAGAEDYGGEVVFRHRWAGVALAVLLVLVALSARATRTRAYTGLLVLSMAAAVLAGHWGATITHGAGYFELDEPMPAAPKGPPVLSGREPLAAARDSVAGAVDGAVGGVQQDAFAEPGDAGASGGAPASSAAGDAGSGDASGAAAYAGAAGVLTERCLACHGPSKQKGRLALHTPEALVAGGFSGPVVVPGAPAESELLRRMQLPLEHEDHMPPEGKPQPTDEEVARVEAWIAAGAPLPDGAFPAVSPEQGPAAPATPPADGTGARAGAAGDEGAQLLDRSATRESLANALTSVPSNAQAGAQGNASASAQESPPGEPTAPEVDVEEALAALRAERLHVEALGPDGSALWIDAATRPDLDDELARALLWPLRARVVELSLARTRVGDAACGLAAAMPGLERLDLRATRVTPEGPAALAGHPALRRLNLSDTAAGAAALEVELPALRELLVHGCELDPQALARAAAARPELDLRSALALGAPLEVEPEVALGPAEPVPADRDGPDADAVAARCPVSGEPADPAFALEVEGRTVFFCCARCPEAWLADPAASEVAAAARSDAGADRVEAEPPADDEAVETAPLRY